MKYYCIANWKMNFNTLDAIKFIDDLIKNNLQNSKTKIILCPSFVSLKEVREKISDYMIELGAQNIHHSDKGAFTGEISANMLKEIECKWVILGHSERRQYFNDGVVALDCGANIGVHSIEWAKIITGWGEVFSFEAQEKIFYALAGNVAINNCFNVTAKHVALGSKVGVIEIPQPNYHQPSWTQIKLVVIFHEYRD